MNADGSGLTLLRAKGDDGWALQGHAEWSPDGKALAMFGTALLNGQVTPQIFVTDTNGKFPKQITNRPGVTTDVSWSPNGGALLFNGCPVVPPVAQPTTKFTQYPQRVVLRCV